VDYYIGLDVSLKKTAVCVVDEAGAVAWEGTADTHPEMIAEAVHRWSGSVKRLGLETGSTTPWLARSLKTLGLPVIVMDARRASDAMKGRPVKTDKADAKALAEMLRAGWYNEVFVKSEDSHRMKAVLSASRQGTKKFDQAVREATRQDDILYACVNALLEALAAIEMQIATLDKQVKAMVQVSKPCWHLTSVPCVGPITALAFAAAIEDPERFRHTRDVGAYLGMTPKRYQSGDTDIVGKISKQGDAMARHYLYEAANCLLTTWSGQSPLKSWGLALIRRVGPKKARVAVARKMACLLLRLWKDGTHYNEGEKLQTT